MTPQLDRLFQRVAADRASDLHLIVGLPPSLRVNGEIILTDSDAFTAAESTQLVQTLLNPVQREVFERDWELCISRHHPTVGRMRITLYRRNGLPELSIRFCGTRAYTREELGLPAKLDDLARKQKGLILVTGATGSGKTTTLNYLINLINHERRCKIVTIEDPIEFVHENNRAIIVQQEVLTDTRSFSSALIHALRQDPDVIVVGEMRDHAAISTALLAAETGHLVLATLHSPSTSQALERIISIFEGNAQRQIIVQLANTLQGIIYQDLLPSVDGGRALACELLVANVAVRNTIREGQFHQLENCLQTGVREGMVLLDTSLHDLYLKCKITRDTAMHRARYPDLFAKRTGGSPGS
jgi:twitching motility protein PilT